MLPPHPPVQLLDDEGNLHEVEGYPLDLKDEDFRNLYRHMVLARRVDKQAINLQRQGQLGVYASLLGQEAAQVGGAYALAEQDWVFPSYREMGAALVRGVDPGKILHLFRGTWLSDHDPMLRVAVRPAVHPDRHPGAARRRASRWGRSSTARTSSS
jgi:2-oxoisovalerate dehydrogenase E1 component alpha subunit